MCMCMCVCVCVCVLPPLQASPATGSIFEGVTLGWVQGLPIYQKHSRFGNSASGTHSPCADLIAQRSVDSGPGHPLPRCLLAERRALRSVARARKGHTCISAAKWGRQPNNTALRADPGH